MQAPELAFVALGSNVGARRDHLRFAREALGALPHVRLRASSIVEETEPIGPIEQGPYLNQMVLLETDLEPEALLTCCLEIEQARGRVRGDRWGPRVLDIDIVRFGDRVVSTPRLTVPHPEISNRHFWQRELAELEAHVAHSK